MSDEIPPTKDLLLRYAYGNYVWDMLEQEAVLSQKPFNAVAAEAVEIGINKMAKRREKKFQKLKDKAAGCPPVKRPPMKELLTVIKGGAND